MTYRQTDEELEAELEQARINTEIADRTEPRAKAAYYDAATRRLVIDLKSGVSVMVPVDLLQGVAGGAEKDIAAVEISGGGYGLHWEALDADITVPGIVSGIYGTKRWMAQLGARALGTLGGSTKTARQAAAARASGLKGGRPKSAPQGTVPAASRKKQSAA